MSVLSHEQCGLSNLLSTVKSGIRSVIEGLGFGVLCMLVYLVPLVIAYGLYQLLV
jgi:hypothetical protein